MSDEQSVSYTHLDVYKRQCTDTSGLRLIREIENKQLGNGMDVLRKMNRTSNQRPSLKQKSRKNVREAGRESSGFRE